MPCVILPFFTSWDSSCGSSASFMGLIFWRARELICLNELSSKSIKAEAPSDVLLIKILVYTPKSYVTLDLYECM